MPGEIVDVVAVQRAYAQAHPERIAALRRVWFESLERLRREPREATAIMALREQMSPEAFATALGGLRFPDRDDNRALLTGPAPRLLESAKKLKSVMRGAGLLSSDVPLEPLFTGPAWARSGAPDSPQ
jgi:NitT/TauT family transport system substrate-binding protein